MAEQNGPRIRLSAESIPVGANVVIDLGPDALAVIESGELSVFAAEQTADGRGPRHFLASFGPGEAAVGVPVTSGLGLIGVGSVGTSINLVPLEPRAEPANGEARKLADGWLTKIHSSLARYRKLAGTSVVEGSNEADPPADGDVVQATTVVLDQVGEALARTRERERERIGRAVERDERITETAVAELASVLTSATRVPVPVSDDPLLEVCRRVAAFNGITIQEPTPGRTDSSEDPLKRILRISRIRSRQVKLDGRWWRSDAGALIARTTDDARPVALLPHRGGYLLIDPASGASKPVDAAIAATLQPNGLVLYRSWPTTRLTMATIFADGLRGSKRDVIRLVVFGLAAALLALLTPILTGTLFNSIIPNADEQRLLVIAGALVLGALAAFGFQVAQGLALVRVQTRLESGLQTALWDRLLRLPAGFFRRFSLGGLAARALSVDQIRRLIAGVGFTAVLGAIFSITSLVLLFVFDVGMAIIATVTVAISVGVFVWLAKASVARSHDGRPCSQSSNVPGLVLRV